MTANKKIALDTNVLLDVLAKNPSHYTVSLRALEQQQAQGHMMIICEFVYAELATVFKGNKLKLSSFLHETDINLTRSSEDALTYCGRLWQRYREKGGKRARLLTDFLIGAHAQFDADYLLTRDRGFYRSYFSRLKLIDPTQRE